MVRKNQDPKTHRFLESPPAGVANADVIKDGYYKWEFPIVYIYDDSLSKFISQVFTLAKSSICKHCFKMR